jgi:polysaccharide chain length determinant protein (PEP-CTERM system associated)
MPLERELSADHNNEPETEISELLARVAGMLLRRRWPIIGLASTTTLATVAFSLWIPNRYTSEATIFAVQQKVPERYVVPTTTADPSQALEAMVREVLSRPQLLAVIDELGLHTEEKKHLKADELIDLVRRDLKVEPVDRMLGRGEVNAFRIFFTAHSPQLAHSVTQRLTTLFIEQNLKTRADQAVTTTEFLQEQLQTARKDLEVQEQRLRDFKMQYLGELPEQQQGNLGILGGLQSQLDNLLARRSQAQQQRLYLESLLSEYARRRKSPAVVRSSTGEIVTPAQSAESDLVRLQTELKNLLLSYTPRHPDVVKKENEIAQQKTLVDALKSIQRSSAEKRDVPAVEETSEPEQDIGVAQLKSQLRANALEIEDLAQKEQKLRADIDTYQSRLNLTPVREQQMASMQRDYDLRKQHYGELLKKQQESQLATDLEKRQEGQQFRLADPPNLPTVPSSPKRVKISLMGLAGGIALGIALAFLLEFRSPSFHAEEEARRELNLPLVVGIPLLLTPAEERRNSRMRVLEWVAASVVLSVVAVAEFYVYRHG